MSKTKSLYDIINNVPAKVKHKRIAFKPVPVGHQLAIKVYQNGIYLDVLFVDHIDICGSYTMIHFNDRLMEEHPQRLKNVIYNPTSLWVQYENNSEFEVIRIN
jgi:hypothetical protein